MKIKELILINNAIHSAIDFVESNTDHDESGIGSEMIYELSKSRQILRKKLDAAYLKNALIKNKRDKNKNK